MSYLLRSLLSGGALLLVLAAPRGASAQGNPQPNSFKFNVGQGVQPIFEGWAKNPDGTFSMYFGYLNRNYVETLVLPVGPDNKIEPGVLDRGQPTVFNTRIQRKQFSVTVPKDWGKKELVWSVTVRGTTERAVAWLQPEWEIDPVYAGKTRSEESLKNTPPKMLLDVRSAVSLPSPLTLTATVQDDGLPVPRKPRQQSAAAAAQSQPPTLKPLPNQAEVPVNVPSVASGNRPRGAQTPQGPVVNWIVWRGPAAVTFDAIPAPVKEGKAVATAIFTTPGTYVLRARANDGELTDEKDVTVTVTAPSQR
jgi:hypothetical protein